MPTLSGRPRLIVGLAGAVALGTGFTMIGPPAMAQADVVAPSVVPAAFQRTPATRATEMAVMIPAVMAAPASGPALPVPVGAARDPAPAQPLLLIADNQGYTSGGVTDSSAGAGLGYAGFGQGTPLSAYLQDPPALTTPAVSSPGGAPIVLAGSAQQAGPPVNAAPAASTSAPNTEVHVLQAAGCVAEWCVMGAQNSDNNGNYNYTLGAGINLTLRPVTASVTNGQQDIWASGLRTTPGAGLVGTYSWSSGPVSVRVTGQMEFPLEQAPTAIAYSLGVGDLARWAAPDYFPPLTPTFSVGGNLTLKGSALLYFVPGLAPIVPDSVKAWMDKLQYSKGGFYSYNSETGEDSHRTTDGEKLQFVGSDGYLVAYVKIPSQSSLTDLAKQVGGLVLGDKPTPSVSPTPNPSDTAQPAPSDSAQPGPTAQPTPADSNQPSPSDSAQPAPSDSVQPGPSDSPQPNPTDQPAPADSNQPNPSPQPTDGSQQPTAPVDQPSPTDGGQQPTTPPDQPNPTAQPGPADSAQPNPPASPADGNQAAPSAPPNPGDTPPPDPAAQQPTPADSAQPGPVGQADPAATAQPDPAATPNSGDAPQTSPVDGSQPTPAPVGQANPADQSNGLAGTGSEPQPAPIGGGQSGANTTDGSRTIGTSSASAIGSTSAGNAGSGTTSSSPGTSSYGGLGSPASTSTGTTSTGTASTGTASAGGTSYGGTSTGTSTAGTSTAGTSTAGTSTGGTSYGGTSGGSTSTGGGTSYAGTSGGSTSSAGTTSGGTSYATTSGGSTSSAGTTSGGTTSTGTTTTTTTSGGTSSS